MKSTKLIALLMLTLMLVATMALGQNKMMDKKGHMMMKHQMSKKGHMMSKKGHMMSKKGHMMMKKGHMMDKKGHMMSKKGHMMSMKGHMTAKQKAAWNKMHPRDSHGRFIKKNKMMKKA